MLYWLPFVGLAKRRVRHDLPEVDDLTVPGIHIIRVMSSLESCRNLFADLQALLSEVKPDTVKKRSVEDPDAQAREPHP